MDHIKVIKWRRERAKNEGKKIMRENVVKLMELDGQ